MVELKVPSLIRIALSTDKRSKKEIAEAVSKNANIKFTEKDLHKLTSRAGKNKTKNFDLKVYYYLSQELELDLNLLMTAHRYDIHIVQERFIVNLLGRELNKQERNSLKYGLEGCKILEPKTPQYGRFIKSKFKNKEDQYRSYTSEKFSDYVGVEYLTRNIKKPAPGIRRVLTIGEMLNSPLTESLNILRHDTSYNLYQKYLDVFLLAENGDLEKANRRVITILSNFAEISEGKYLGIKKELVYKEDNTQRIPLVKNVRRTTDLFKLKDEQETFIRDISNIYKKTQEYVAVSVTDNALIGEGIVKGSVAILELSESRQIGEKDIDKVVGINIYESEEIKLRKIKKISESHYILVTLNQDQNKYPPIKYNEKEMRLVGKVVKVFKNF